MIEHEELWSQGAPVREVKAKDFPNLQALGIYQSDLQVNH